MDFFELGGSGTLLLARHVVSSFKRSAARSGFLRKVAAFLKVILEIVHPQTLFSDRWHVGLY